ncbi:Rieske 2Fe-2S domain-containing protein [Sphingomonas histidinilytica]|jgi:nitrite reductase/ring-hydroxylating ferredoxin subunit|uniref:aromatic ring-hydroxylating oxygenase subunit alpha n=1 Tax=Rhizorhabdus histidinilytica TaxID=439228 RepID=UPI000F785B4F|nr:Rieske 2Fe-2S domain-containing protein [Rhizorhabdus histidinilytica]MBO9375604.1 Rieske 2Fe-2S domain-containing protein [Rhizorhabdus histidinilytica]QEH81047.1 Rieske 2Fe-2S domain-containing protein [Sphingomonas sp. C8-2]
MTIKMVEDAPTAGRKRERRRLTRPVPMEGDNGVFSQTWFPIALSSEVAQGQVIGRDFLDGKVVVFRGENGQVTVASAYCPHVGADLSVGAVVGNHIQCAFHRWEFDQEGWVAKTGVGDPPPPAACLYVFPSQERFGIIWAFNGDEPLWDLFDFEFPDSELEFRPFKTDVYTCDPWIFAANTPDIQHIKAVHGIRFKMPDPHDAVEWDPYGFRMRLAAIHQQGEDLDWNVGIRGTSTFIQEGSVDGWWMGVAAGFACPRPGTHIVYLAIAVKKGDGTPEGDRLVDERLTFGTELLARTAREDKPILDTIHYMPGALTRGDTSLARWLDIVRNYPRAHPSRDFIN